VSPAPLVFLDANVVFSAALGGEAMELLFALAAGGAIRLVSSRSCVLEAETNLARKRPDRHDRLIGLLGALDIDADAPREGHVVWAAELVHPDDVHVLASARQVGADVLVTGDSSHFGELMERDDLGLRVMTPRTFLLAGPRGS
jgi:uncharacterized protein